MRLLLLLIGLFLTISSSAWASNTAAVTPDVSPLAAQGNEEACAERFNVPLHQVTEGLDFICSFEIPNCLGSICYVETQDWGAPAPMGLICSIDEEVARNRVGDKSITCFISNWYVMEMAVGNILFLIEAQEDPLPLAQSFANGTEFIASSGATGERGDTSAGDTADTASGVDLSACSGLDAAADAECIAGLALESDDYSVCFAAIDVYACGAAVLSQIADPCAGQSGDEAISCHLVFAGSTGIEASCELLPAEAQGACFVFAVATSGDISLIERRFPPGADRDIAYTTLAVTQHDPTYIEFIEDNERYDAARIYMVVPAMANGVALDASYCDGLRGNYVSEYPEDADRNRRMCEQFVAWSQEMAKIEDDAEKVEFMAQVLRDMGGDESIALAEQMEQAAQAIRDGDAIGLQDAFQGLLGGE